MCEVCGLDDMMMMARPKPISGPVPPAPRAVYHPGYHPSEKQRENVDLFWKRHSFITK